MYLSDWAALLFPGGGLALPSSSGIPYGYNSDREGDPWDGKGDPWESVAPTGSFFDDDGDGDAEWRVF